jgi:hypothetical protein
MVGSFTPLCFTFAEKNRDGNLYFTKFLLSVCCTGYSTVPGTVKFRFSISLDVCLNSTMGAYLLSTFTVLIEMLVLFWTFVLTLIQVR